jgi:dUTP pyrophosphatase
MTEDLFVNATTLNPSTLPVQLLSEIAQLPTKGSIEAAGHDLYSAEDLTIPPHDQALVDTQIAVAIPRDAYGRVAPRSGLAVKSKIGIAAGVIDADYRGSIKVLLVNNADKPFIVKPGDRIAQLIIEKIHCLEALPVTHLEDTPRGNSGFGSTDVAVKTIVVKKPEERLRLISQHHDTLLAGHPGIAKTLDLLRRNYSWPTM